MDLNENIRIAAEQYELLTSIRSEKVAFINGAKSQAAKDYWYNEFKREQFISQDVFPSEIEPIVFSDGSIAKPLIGYKDKNFMKSDCGPTDEENELLQKQVVEPTYTTVQKDGDRRVTIVIPDLSKLDGVPEEYKRAKEYQKYIDEHPDRPISFNNWKYMVEHYPNQSYHATKKQFEPGKPFKWIDKAELDCAMRINNKSIESMLSGNSKSILDEVNDTMIGVGYKAVTKEMVQEIADRVLPKTIGIIGHVNHGSSCLGLRTVREKFESKMNGLIERNEPKVIIIVSVPDIEKHSERIMKIDGPLSREIKSIVPIANVIPDKIEILNAYDKAEKATILREKYEMDKPWNTKKEKKVSHKRTNKRK